MNEGFNKKIYVVPDSRGRGGEFNHIQHPNRPEGHRYNGGTFKDMIMLLPPIFVMLGLLDVWVPRETMAKFMGEGSGVKGVVLSILIGSAAAGPLYAAFPVAAVFIKKGVKFSNIMIFLGAWSTTKIPTIMFETASLGAAFALTRLAVNIPGIIIIAYLLTRLTPKSHIEKIRENISKN